MDDTVEVRRVTEGGLSYEILTPPNKLKQKVGDGGFDPVAVAQAHRAVQAMTGDFVGQARAHVASLKVAVDRAAADGGLKVDSVQLIYDKTHELRGEGGSFGFPLITSIGALLCGYIDRAGSPDAAELDVVSAHIDAMNAIIASGTTGVDNATAGKSWPNSAPWSNSGNEPGNPARAGCDRITLVANAAIR